MKRLDITFDQHCNIPNMVHDSAIGTTLLSMLTEVYLELHALASKHVKMISVVSVLKTIIISKFKRTMWLASSIYKNPNTPNIVDASVIT